MKKHAVWLLIFGLTVGTLLWFWLATPVTTQGAVAGSEPGLPVPRGDEGGSVEGVVVELDGGPIAGAIVRQQTTINATASGPDGSFSLGGLPEGITVTVTGWYTGYLVGGAQVKPPQTGVTITLKPHYTTDNPDYRWLSASKPTSILSCMHCMVAYPQWQANAHGNSAINPRFFSLYNGTYLTMTTVVSPGYKLDFPGTTGNCAACHAPAAAIDGIPTPFTGTVPITGTFVADMNELSLVETEGVLCEFCHKVGDVYLDSGGLPHDERPGVFSMRLYRSPRDGVLFFGPFDDVMRRVSYQSLEKKSQFCAPCHQFSFHGTPIYQSFQEWLESPYPAQGTKCQTCHMAPTGVDYFALPSEGGLTRDPALIASHLQPGASDVALLQNTVSMTLSARQIMDHVQVTVSITNTGAGHHVPTDHPGRHMILTVGATDERGQILSQQSGPMVPGWGGAQAGLAGQAFAKVLSDVATGETPTVSYWKPTTIISDNRIAALDSDKSVYTFAAPVAGGPVTVTAELRFRRLFQTILDAKGWSTPDIVMEEREVGLSTDPWWGLFLPLIWKDG